VDHPAVEPMVSVRPARPRVALAVVLLALLGVYAVVGSATPALAAAPAFPALTGNVNGPFVVATDANSTYYVNGTGGPAIASNGTDVGTISWKAHLSGVDLTGVTLSPNSSTLKPGTPSVAHLKVSKFLQTITITVEITSEYQTTSSSINITKTVQVVVPYVVRAQLFVGPGEGVLGFDVTVLLDGNVVGTVAVPSIKANGTYNLTYNYATTGLSAGEHTFTISLAHASALVTFQGGARQFSESFYVVGPAPDYLLYVIVGIVVFAGVLFILVTRVAARRRPSSSKK
jgi:hypothetical protein